MGNYVDNSAKTEENQLAQIHEEEEDGEDEKEDLSEDEENYIDNNTETEENKLVHGEEEETLNEDDDCVPSFKDDPEKYAEEYDEENAGFGYQTMEIEPIEITKPASVANVKVETPSTQSDGFPCPLCTLS